MNILVIRRDNIGDLVCTTPALATLRQSFPEAWIGVLVNSYNVAVLQDNPSVDAVFAYRKAKHLAPGESRWKTWFQTALLLWRLRRRQIDVAIVASPGGTRYARLIGARKIIADKATTGLHEVEAVEQMLAPLGVAPGNGPLQIFPSAPRVAALQRAFGALHDKKQIWAVHLSAREASRQWPTQHYIDLMQALAAPERGFALFWSPGRSDNPMHPGDDEKAAAVLATCDNLGVLAMPTHCLDDLIAGLARCHGFIGADGGAMHVAVAVGLPTVALFENSAAKRCRWHPWQVPYRLLQASTFAVHDIAVDAVVDAVRELEAASAAG